MIEDIEKDANDRMGKSFAAFEQELKKLRTGRAHTSLLDHIHVEYYGSDVPLSQVANIGVEDSRTLTVTPHSGTTTATPDRSSAALIFATNCSLDGTAMWSS